MTHAVPLLALRRSGARPKASRAWAAGCGVFDCSGWSRADTRFGADTHRHTVKDRIQKQTLLGTAACKTIIITA